VPVLMRGERLHKAGTLGEGFGFQDSSSPRP
jgi:hypothetical protein